MLSVAIGLIGQWPLSVYSAQTLDPLPQVLVVHQDAVFNVTAHYDIPVNQTTAWSVLTDFDHFPLFLHNVQSVHVLNHSNDRYRIEETGEAQWGIISMSYQNVREITVYPERLITSHTLSGTVKSMQTRMEVSSHGANQVSLDYHATIEPDSWLASLFGTDFIESEVKEQFQSMAQEMIKRQNQSTIN